MINDRHAIGRPATGALLIFLAALCGPASAEPQSAGSGGERPQLNAPPPNAAEAEIIVRGQRVSDRYRIPVELRAQPAETDRRARTIDPRLACQSVGPIGCGTEVLPILTVGSGGDMQVGAVKEP